MPFATSTITRLYNQKKQRNPNSSMRHQRIIRLFVVGISFKMKTIDVPTVFALSLGEYPGDASPGNQRQFAFPRLEYGAPYGERAACRTIQEREQPPRQVHCQPTDGGDEHAIRSARPTLGTKKKSNKKLIRWVSAERPSKYLTSLLDSPPRYEETNPSVSPLILCLTLML